MNVLILHQHFNRPDQGGPLRSYFLARALLDKGVQVSVISAHNQKEKVLTEVDGITLLLLPVPYSNHYGFGQRVGAYLRFARKAIGASRELQQPHLVYAMSTPLTVALAALWLRWVRGIPFYFEAGDVWPDAPIQLGFVKNPVLKWALRSFEQVVYSSSRAIIALSPDQQRIVKSRTRRTVHLVPNMADVDFFRSVPKLNAMEQAFGVKDKFVITYAGAVSFANGLDYMILTASECQKSQLPVHFFLCGDGNALERLKSMARHEALNNLTFLPFRTREGVRELLSITDATMICYRDAPVLTTGCPNKYFDGLAAGKIIITNFEGWISREIMENGCGIAVDIQNPASLIPALKELIKDQEKVKSMKAASRQLAETAYSRTLVSRRFASIIEHALTTDGL